MIDQQVDIETKDGKTTTFITHPERGGPFPVILMGEKFWAGLRQWGQFMIKQGVFAKEEIGFGYVTDSPHKAVDLIVRSLPSALRSQLKPLAAT